MFKDVISRGWLRLHVLLSILSSPLIFLFFVLIGEHMNDKDMNRSFILMPIIYWILLFFIVWVKRGFKKS